MTQWEYVKGSEADFEGAEEWVTLLTSDGNNDGERFFVEKHENGAKYRDVNSSWIGNIDNEFLDFSTVPVFAERRKVEKKDPFAHLNDLPLVSEGYPTPTEALITERGNRYGDFKDGAAIMQQLKDVMKGAPKWEALKSSQKEALEMIQHKIGRILNGDPDYDDNWKDIAGYATLIVKEIEG